MALALQNPSPNRVRRVAQYAKAKGIGAAAAWDAAGFKKGTAIKQRGNKSASSAWKSFWAKSASGKRWGRSGARGGKTTGKGRQAAWNVYYSRFNKDKPISFRQKRKAHVIKLSDKGGLQHLAMNKARAAYRAKKGNSKGFAKSAAAKRIKGFNMQQLKSAAGKSGSQLLKAIDRVGARKGKRKAVAERLRASGKLRAFPPRRKAGKGKSVRRGATGRRFSVAKTAAKYRKQGMSQSEAMKKAWGHHGGKGVAANNNPFGALALENGLALTNQGLGGIGTFALGLGAAGVSAGLGYAAIQFADDYATEWYAQVPVVGGALEAASNTTTAILLSTAIGMTGAGAMVMGALPAGRAAGVVGGAIAGLVGIGLVMDMTSAGGPMEFGENLMAGITGGAGAVGDADFTSGEISDEELAMGALALENYGALALENGYGDGMAYELAPLTADMGELDYSQASLADAYYSGADFDMGEGQALLNGPTAWRRRFGLPTKRTSRKADSTSHLAGKRAHRWGWCIKFIGFKRCAALAALPPKKRIAAIKKIRAAAIQAFQQMRLSHARTEVVPGVTTLATTPAPTVGEFGLPSTTPVTPAEFVAPAAGVVSAAPFGPNGASGAGGELGAFLFTSN